VRTLFTITKTLSKKKWDRAFDGPFHTSKKDLRRINIFRGLYDEDFNPVCPWCGQYDQQPKDYGYEYVNGERMLWFIGVCRVCNTVFKFNRRDP